MRPTAIIPLLFSLVAFILSLLCVFAGSKRGYLEQGDLLTVSSNTGSRVWKANEAAQYLHAWPFDPQHLQILVLAAKLDRN